MLRIVMLMIVVLMTVVPAHAQLSDGIRVIIRDAGLPGGITEHLGDGITPRGHLRWFVFTKWCRNDADKAAALQFGFSGPARKCYVTSRGLVNNLVTTEGKQRIAAYFADAVGSPLPNFHALSTSTSTPVVGDTGCPSEFTTQYSPDNTRTAGTKSSSGQRYTSQASYTIDQSVTIQKFCMMTTSTSGTGVSLTHILTGAIPVVAGQSVTTIYDLDVN